MSPSSHGALDGGSPYVTLFNLLTLQCCPAEIRGKCIASLSNIRMTIALLLFLTISQNLHVVVMPTSAYTYAMVALSVGFWAFTFPN